MLITIYANTVENISLLPPETKKPAGISLFHIDGIKRKEREHKVKGCGEQEGANFFVAE